MEQRSHKYLFCCIPQSEQTRRGLVCVCYAPSFKALGNTGNSSKRSSPLHVRTRASSKPPLTSVISTAMCNYLKFSLSACVSCRVMSPVPSFKQPGRDGAKTEEHHTAWQSNICSAICAGSFLLSPKATSSPT